MRIFLEPSISDDALGEFPNLWVFESEVLRSLVGSRGGGAKN